MPDLPLDIRGTAFQRQVWEALQAIPMGQTRTYSDLAAAIGRPKAIRAVGSACANNPVSLIIPCHRAIGTRWYAARLPLGPEAKEITAVDRRECGERVTGQASACSHQVRALISAAVLPWRSSACLLT